MCVFFFKHSSFTSVCRPIPRQHSVGFCICLDAVSVSGPTETRPRGTRHARLVGAFIASLFSGRFDNNHGVRHCPHETRRRHVHVRTYSDKSNPINHRGTHCFRSAIKQAGTVWSGLGGVYKCLFIPCVPGRPTLALPNRLKKNSPRFRWPYILKIGGDAIVRSSHVSGPLRMTPSEYLTSPSLAGGQRRCSSLPPCWK